MIAVLLIQGLLLIARLSDGATLQGTVRAESSREPIANANVVVKGVNRLVMTDQHGYFVLANIPEGRWQVTASALGYRSHGVTVVSSGTGAVRLDFELERQPVELAGVEARTRARDGEGPLAADRTAGPPALHISGSTLKRVPGLAEADVLRALQTLPSVAAASDFSSALYVRGGSPDQTLITLDGLPLFNPYHLGGIFAAIDPDAVASVDAFAGALPAHLADRVSGAVQIRTRDGGKDRVRAQGAIGLLSSRAGVDGPLPGGRGSFLFSARRTYLDLFTDAAYRLGLVDGTVPYAFTDAHLKLTHSAGELGFVSATVYVDHEGVDMPSRMRDDTGYDVRFGWGSKAATIALRQPFGSSVLGDFRIGVSDFTGGFRSWDIEGLCQPCINDEPPPSQRVSVLDANSVQRDILAAADLTWYRTSHEIRAGLGLDKYLFRHRIEADGDEFDEIITSLARRDSPFTATAYVEDEWHASEALRLSGGMRVLHAGERGTVLLPRLGARLALSQTLGITIGAGRYAQVMSSLRNEESLAASFLAYDLVVAPPNKGIVRGEDVVIGAEWRPAASASIRLDAYAKRATNVPLPPVPDDALMAPIFATEDVHAGKSYARGIEVLARYATGRTELMLSYALAFAEREVNGDRFPARFERRHLVDATGTTPLGKRGELSLRLAIGSGQPYTPVIGVGSPVTFDPALGGFWPGYNNYARTVLLGEHNADRLPGYLRLDVGMRRDFDKKWFGRETTVTPYLQILNVLNTKNTLMGDPTAYDGPLRVEHLPQLPFLPTLGVEWHF